MELRRHAAGVASKEVWSLAYCLLFVGISSFRSSRVVGQNACGLRRTFSLVRGDCHPLRGRHPVDPLNLVGLTHYCGSHALKIGGPHTMSTVQGIPYGEDTSKLKRDWPG